VKLEKEALSVAKLLETKVVPQPDLI